jgi:hypothetical protein
MTVIIPLAALVLLAGAGIPAYVATHPGGGESGLGTSSSEPGSQFGGWPGSPSPPASGAAAASAGPGSSTGPSSGPSSGPGAGSSGGPSGGASTTQPAIPRRNNCLAKPSACGFPDETNTGVPAGTRLTTVSGDQHLNQAGRVYSGLNINGCVLVEADNVTLQNSRINAADCPHYVIRTFTPRQVTGFVLKNSEIDFGGQWDTKGIAFENFTVDGVYFHDGADCVHFSDGVVMRNSYCVIPAHNGPEHLDGVQTDGGNNALIEHNTIVNRNGQTAAILIDSDLGSSSGNRIVNNLLDGGGWTVYCDARSTGKATSVLKDNRIGRSGRYGPLAYCESVPTNTGNVWDDTGAPLS